jgi:hypothetical protein
VIVTRVHVTNFLSVEDSTEFEIEPDITCLVGKNESGKTAVLQAIYRSNPVETSVTFREAIDFPSRLTGQRRTWKPDEQVPVVKLTMELEAPEMADLERVLGGGVLTSRTVTVTTGYRIAETSYDLAVDQAVIVNHLRRQLDISLGTHDPVANASTIAEFYAALTDILEPTSTVTKMIQRIEAWPERDVELHIVDQYLDAWTPKFLYFDDYDVMPGKVSIPDLINRRGLPAPHGLTRGERALLSLLSMADVRLEDFQGTTEHEELIRQLENTGNVISDEVFQYWTQNDQLEAELKVLEPETSAVPPLNQGPILQVRVHNRRHRASVPFDD